MLERKLGEFNQRGGSFEGNNSVLYQRIKTLENIKEKLEMRLRELEKELNEKDEELETMKSQ